MDEKGCLRYLAAGLSGEALFGSPAGLAGVMQCVIDDEPNSLRPNSRHRNGLGRRRGVGCCHRCGLSLCRSQSRWMLTKPGSQGRSVSGLQLLLGCLTVGKAFDNGKGLEAAEGRKANHRLAGLRLQQPDTISSGLRGDVTNG